MAQPKARRRRIGHLDVIEVEGASEDSPTIVLFHGFGADCGDLASLSQVVQAPKGCRWIFPNGHLAVQLGPHQEGRAWFPISIADLEKTVAAGTGVDLSALTPPGLRRARDMALEMIEKLKVPMDRLILGGFSQGAMLATELALNTVSAPAGLAILSGTLVNAPVWESLAPQRAGLRFFQSHGVADPVLSCAMAEKLNLLLNKAGLRGSLMKFQGGHDIPSEVLIQLGSFVREVMPKSGK
jgi:phospholipase/carboxylesterase